MKRRQLSIGDVVVSEDSSATAPSLRCGLCSNNNKKQIRAVKDFVQHIVSSHASVIDTSDLDNLRRIIFVAEARKLTGQNVPETFCVIGSSKAHLRCPGCSRRVVLLGPYAVGNFAAHLRDKRCFEQMKSPSKKPGGSKKRPADGPLADDCPSKIPNLNGLNKLKGKAGVSAVCGDRDGRLQNGSISKTSPLSNSGKSERKMENVQGRQPGTMRQSAPITCELRMQKALQAYNYMSSSSKFSDGRPAYRPYLMRTLSFVRKQKLESLSVKSRRRRCPTSDESTPSICGSDFSRLQKTATVKFYGFRNNLLPGTRKARIELYLQSSVGKEDQMTRLPSASFEMTVNGQSLRQQATTIDLPPVVTDRRLNNEVGAKHWLVIHALVSGNKDSVSSGGRSLRGVASRKADLAAEKGGGKSVGKMRNKEKEEGGRIELFGVKVLADSTQGKGGLIEGDASIPLIDQPFVRTQKSWKEDSKFASSLYNEMKNTRRMETADSFMLATVTGDDSESDEESDDGVSSSTSTSALAGTSEWKNRSGGFPARLLYRFMHQADSDASVAEGKQVLNGWTTEVSETDRCIFCDYRFGELYSLLKHLRSAYPRLQFIYRSAEAGVYLPTIDVRLSKDFEVCYEGNPVREYQQELPASPLKADQNPTLVLVTRNEARRARKRARHLSEFYGPTERSTYRPSRPVGHVRTYFNARSRQPFPAAPKLSTQICTDPEWLKATIHRQMDEFSDLNEGEKKLMAMWSLFLAKKENRCLGACMVFRTLEAFVHQYKSSVIRDSLVCNFTCHLTHLEELGLITAEQLVAIISHLTN